jgi:hypothetical protein
VSVDSADGFPPWSIYWVWYSIADRTGTRAEGGFRGGGFTTPVDFPRVSLARLKYCGNLHQRRTPDAKSGYDFIPPSSARYGTLSSSRQGSSSMRPSKRPDRRRPVPVPVRLVVCRSAICEASWTGLKSRVLLLERRCGGSYVCAGPRAASRPRCVENRCRPEAKGCAHTCSFSMRWDQRRAPPRCQRVSLGV